MAIDDEGEDNLAEEYLQHVWMNETRAYIERGRAFEALSSDKVLETWIAMFERWFGKRTSAHARDMNDLAAEIRLRGLEVPYESVGDKARVLLVELLERGAEEDCSKLDRKIDDFFDARRRPKN